MRNFKGIIAVHADAWTKTLKVPKSASIKAGKSKTLTVTATLKWSITKEIPVTIK